MENYYLKADKGNSMGIVDKHSTMKNFLPQSQEKVL